MGIFSFFVSSGLLAKEHTSSEADPLLSLPPGTSDSRSKSSAWWWVRVITFLAILAITIGLVTEGICSWNKRRALRGWWDRGADKVQDDFKNLHKGSNWHYMTELQYEDMVLDAVSYMVPPIKNGESVFELGVGVGATLQVLRHHWRDLELGGSDYAQKPLMIARKVHPGALLLQNNMTSDTPLPLHDGQFDHVISIGALGMYLTTDQMVSALSEAARITKPCGSMVFTNFIEPSGKWVGSIIQKVEKRFWVERLPSLGFEKIETHQMGKTQHDRYLLVARKACPSGFVQQSYPPK